MECGFFLKYGSVPAPNLLSGSDVSKCQSDVNIKPATVSSPSDFEILIPQVEKPGEGTRDFGENSVQFVHVTQHVIQ